MQARLLGVPGVRSALMQRDHRRVAVLINRWLAPKIPAPRDKRSLVQTYQTPFADSLRRFRLGLGGVLCDGWADMLLAALRILEVDASR